MEFVEFFQKSAVEHITGLLLLAKLFFCFTVYFRGFFFFFFWQTQSIRNSFCCVAHYLPHIFLSLYFSLLCIINKRETSPKNKILHSICMYNVSLSVSLYINTRCVRCVVFFHTYTRAKTIFCYFPPNHFRLFLSVLSVCNDVLVFRAHCMPIRATVCL